jgi:hypothetical protein
VIQSWLHVELASKRRLFGSYWNGGDAALGFDKCEDLTACINPESLTRLIVSRHLMIAIE